MRNNNSMPRMVSTADLDQRFVCVADFEASARNVLNQNALVYCKSGADDEFTLSLNKESMKRWRIRPRVLRDVSTRSLSTTALGEPVSIPFGVAPSAMQCLVQPFGELANARAVEEIGGVYILSTFSSYSLEDVARAAPKAVKWFQLYIIKDRCVTEQLVRRAEAAGYKALVLTVDAPVLGNRRAQARFQFSVPDNVRFANFEETHGANGTTTSTEGSGFKMQLDDMLDASLSWEDVKWLKQLTKLPLVLKGVLTKEDALMGIEAGADAIFVSNHGARQLDGAPSSMEALSEIVPAVQGRCEVYVDGGFDQGGNIFKALALGASMVFVGRPALWGLAERGQAGVQKVLQILKKELDTTMALAGCTSLDQVTRDMVVHECFYSRM